MKIIKNRYFGKNVPACQQCLSKLQEEQLTNE